ncbi:hypothetical protein AV530_019469 [Patagioenas fasciata monilis]|uniref:C2H2-type domain-containing protein n=1 Tax=Patagioenas fasciata monilis TaxID=372326 RepID=A0A1V4JDT2_PATFA|nr:hypothetical protein AV530_019469 [Patagioenas fasciata monilis]
MDVLHYWVILCSIFHANSSLGYFEEQVNGKGNNSSGLSFTSSNKSHGCGATEFSSSTGPHLLEARKTENVISCDRCCSPGGTSLASHRAVRDPGSPSPEEPELRQPCQRRGTGGAGTSTDTFPGSRMWTGLCIADRPPKTFARPKKCMSEPKMNSETEKREAKQESAKSDLLEVENNGLLRRCQEELMTQVTHTCVLTRGGTEQLPWKGAGEDAQELLLLELLLKPLRGDSLAEETPLLSPCSAALGGQEEVSGEQIRRRGTAESWEPAAALLSLRYEQQLLLPSACPAHLYDSQESLPHLGRKQRQRSPRSPGIFVLSIKKNCDNCSGRSFTRTSHVLGKHGQ